MSKAQHTQKPKSPTMSHDAARVQAAAARNQGKSGSKKRDQDMATQLDLENHSNQLNPNNDVYWQSRGWDERR